MLWKNMGNFKNKRMYAPNHRLHLVVHVEGLGLLGSEGAMEVDGFNVEDDEDGILVFKREYAWVWQPEHKLNNNPKCVSRKSHNKEKKKGPFCNTLKLHLLVVLQDKALDPLLKVDFTKIEFLLKFYQNWIFPIKTHLLNFFYQKPYYRN